MQEISIRQDKPANLYRLGAARRLYAIAKLRSGFGTALAVILAITAIPVRLWMSAASVPLAALTACVVLLNELVIRGNSDRLVRKAVACQDRYDSNVFGLVPDPSLSAAIDEDEIHAIAGRRAEVIDSVKEWYPTDVPQDWPTSVLLCQKVSVNWAKRLHKIYGSVLIALTALILAVSLGAGLLADLSLAGYLIGLLLPALPIALQAGRFSRSHSAAATARTEISTRITRNLAEPSACTLAELQEIQLLLNAARSASPLIPDRLYRSLLCRFEEDAAHLAAAHGI